MDLYFFTYCLYFCTFVYLSVNSQVLDRLNVILIKLESKIFEVNLLLFLFSLLFVIESLQKTLYWGISDLERVMSALLGHKIRAGVSHTFTWAAAVGEPAGEPCLCLCYTGGCCDRENIPTCQETFS